MCELNRKEPAARGLIRELDKLTGGGDQTGGDTGPDEPADASGQRLVPD